MAGVVKLKFDSGNLKYDTDSINNAQSTFVRNCNNKLVSIGLQVNDFKTGKGNFAFTKQVAEKLIQLEEFNVKHNLSKVKKESYDSIDLTLMKEYFTILEDLIRFHFNGDREKMYLLKINALQIEVKINKEKYNIIYDLFLEDSKKSYFLMLEKDLAKIIVEIYSVNKYPYLTEMDRVSLLHDLYENLTEVVSNHFSAIKIANNFRSSEDEEFKEMPIEQIISEYQS